MSTISFPTQAQTLTAAANKILTSAKEEKLDWKEFDTSSFPPDLAVLYRDMLIARKAFNKARTAFEDAACVPIGALLKIKPGQDVKFGYNFGKFSVALADKRATKARTALSF